MTRTKILFCAFVLAVLSYFILSEELPKQDAQRRADLWLEGASADQLTSVRVQHGDKELILKKSPSISADGVPAAKFGEAGDLSAWRLADLPHARLDPAALNGLLQPLLGLQLVNQIPPNEREADLAVYGLSQPEMTISAVIDGTEHSLLFGKKSEYTLMRYMKPADTDRVYLSASGVFDIASKPATDFRLKSPIAFDITQIAAVEFENRLGRTTVLREETGNFVISDEQRSKADTSGISEILRKLRSLQAVSFFDGDTDKNVESHRLKSPDASITISFRENAKPPIKVILSAAQGGDAATYFKIEGDPTIYSAEGDLISIFMRSPMSLRDRYVVTQNMETVTKITYNEGSASAFSLFKDGAQWKVEGKEADNAFVTDLLVTMSELEAISIQPKADITFIPVASMTLYVGDKPSTLAVSEIRTQNGSPVRYLSTSESKDLYTVADDKLAMFFRKQDVFQKTSDKEMKIQEVPLTASASPTPNRS